MMKRNVLAAISLLAVGVVVGIALVSYFSSNSRTNLFANEKIGADKAPIETAQNVQAINEAFVKVSEAVIPTVVSIRVVIETRDFSNPFLEQWKEFFKHFGGEPFEQPQQPHRSVAHGSGVIVSPDGYIVTNCHVVDKAKEIKIKTSDKKEYEGELVGKDPYTDLALIKIDAEDLPTAHLANKEDIRVGEFVLAVGNPLGLNSTVTNGIISAIGRGGLALPNSRKLGGYAVENFIQTDAPINHGNSGGGLFSLEGSLVGINSAIASRTGSYIGYGFAIPVDLVKAVIKDLIEDGVIDRGYIGIRIRTVDETDAKAVGLEKVEGVMVHDIVEGGAGEKAGLKAGDVILEVNGRKVGTSNELQSVIVRHRAGDEVTLTVWRNEEKIKKTVELQSKEEDEEISKMTDEKEEETEEKDGKINFKELGFTVKPISNKMKKKYDIEHGVIVTEVESHGPADQRGLFVGSVITKANNKNIYATGDLKEIIDSKEPGDGVLLFIRYKDTNRVIALEIPEE